MFFYIIPLGIRAMKIERVFLAYMLVGILIYRFLMSFAFPELQIPITTYFNHPGLSVEFVSALYQSTITPNAYPEWVGNGHAIFCLISTIAMIFFWMFFGSSLEMRLGKNGFLAILALGVFLGIAVGLFPLNSLGPTFWVGHVVTIFMIGVCGTLFLTEDVQMYYHLMIVFLDNHAGKFNIPVPVPLFIILILMVLPTGVMFYERPPDTLPIRLATVPPLAWNTVILFLGLLVGHILSILVPKKDETPA